MTTIEAVVTFTAVTATFAFTLRSERLAPWYFGLGLLSLCFGLIVGSGLSYLRSDSIYTENASGEIVSCKELRASLEKHDRFAIERAKTTYAEYLSMKNSDMTQHEVDQLYSPKEITKIKKVLDAAIEDSFEENYRILHSKNCTKDLF